MNIKKVIMVGIVSVAASALALDYVEVIDVAARQRYPWNGLVDIDFELDSHATEPYMMKVTVFDNVGKTNLPVKTVYTENVSQKGNPCMVTKDTARIVWDAASDLPDGFKCTNVLVTCQDERLIDDPRRYMIVDLSAGANAAIYSVTYTNRPPSGGWTDEYKTAKLVLRKIDAGTFMMGSPDDEIGRKANEDYHEVTLTTNYYLSVFEISEKQYSLVVGDSANTMKPVLVKYADIRGDPLKKGVLISDPAYSKSDYCWPDSQMVYESSFLGCLRTRTMINSFDLPTEAQWEFAARGGCSRAVNIGMDCSQTSVSIASRNINNRGDGKGEASSMTVTYVGMYMPNSLGIYDMLGNAAEWVVDAYEANLGSDAVENPKGGEATIVWPGNKATIRRTIKGGGVVGGDTSGSSSTYFGIWYYGTLCGNVYNNSFLPYEASRSAARATNDASPSDYVNSIKCGFRIMCYEP